MFVKFKTDVKHTIDKDVKLSIRDLVRAQIRIENFSIIIRHIFFVITFLYLSFYSPSNMIYSLCLLIKEESPIH